MLAALPLAIALGAGMPEPPAGGPASMRICISRWAAATPHPSRGQISRNRETTKAGDQVSPAARARTQSYVSASCFDSKRARPWPIGDGTGNHALRSGPCGRLAGQAGKRAHAGLVGFGERQALAFLELAELPVRETRRAPILHVSQ